MSGARATASATFAFDAATRVLTLDPREDAFVQAPALTYARMHAEAPMFFWQQYGYWCFAAHADVNALLRDRRFGRQVTQVVSRAELGWPEPPAHLASVTAFERHSLLELEPPEHTRIRSLVNPAFLGRVIEKLRPRIAHVASQCLDGIAPQGEADLLTAFAMPIPVRVIAGMLGVPESMAPQLLAWSHDMVAIYQARRDETIEREAARATDEFSAYVRELLRTRRADAGADDLVGMLLDARENDAGLSEAELISTIILLLNAGHEATVHALGNGVKTLLEREIDTQLAFADPAATATCVEELLRFDPPLHLFTRYCLEPCEFHNTRFERGQRIGLLLGAANADPARFEAPHEFRPRRAPNPHVSFGAGIHFCVGAPLARLEMQMALPLLFQRFPRLRLNGQPRYRDTYHFHGLEALPVTW